MLLSYDVMPLLVFLFTVVAFARVAWGLGLTFGRTRNVFALSESARSQNSTG